MSDTKDQSGLFVGNFACKDCGSRDNLSIYKKEGDDGNEYHDGFCWSCEKKYKSPSALAAMGYEVGDLPEPVDGGRKQTPEEIEALVEDILENYEVRGVRERKIPLAIAQMYGMRVGYHPVTGKICEHYYPVTKKEDENGPTKITGFYKRELPKKFSSLGDVSNCQLQGQHLFEEGGEYAKKASKKFIIVTEGFLDMLAVQEIMQKVSPKYITPVVSLPNGINPKAFKQNYKFLNDYEKVLLCVDQDDVGRKGAREMCKHLPLGKASIMSFSEKDGCDMLRKKKFEEFKTAFWTAENYSPAGVVSGQGLWNLVSTKLDSDCVDYPWEGLNKLTHGIRSSEMVTFTAGCVDADTEFLTPTGWKRIADFEEGDKVAQYHDDGSLSYIEPLKYHKYEADKLWKIKSKYGVDQVLSDEHKVVYLSYKGELRKKSLKDIRELQESLGMGFKGRFLTTFEGHSGGSGVDLTDEQIRLMVAVMGDGYFCCNTNYVAVRIKKDRKKARLVSLLEAAGVPYTRKEVAPYGGFEAFRFYAPLRMKNYGEFWWSCNKEQLEIICDECLYWDGNQKNQFYSADKEDVDFLQYAFASIGKRSTVAIDDRESRLTERPCYRLQVAGNKTVGISGERASRPSFEEYATTDGFKYCFTTETGMWVMRRNFRVCVTSNSGTAKSSFARKILHHLLKETDDNIGGIFLEESIRKTGLCLMSLEAKKLLHLPDVEYTNDEMQEAFEKTLGTGRVFLYDHFGSADIDAISEAITYFVKAADCKYIFLDHISIMVSAGGHGDERKALDEICTKLRTLVQELDITLFIISHLKRPSGDKGHEDGAETSLAQLRGSAGIAQLSDIVLGFERNGQHPDPLERNTTTVRVLKNRFSGETGVATRILYNNVTGELIEREEVDDESDVEEFLGVDEIESEHDLTDY